MMLAEEYMTARLAAGEAVRAEQDRERERRRRERVEELLQVRAEGLLAKRLARARAARDARYAGAVPVADDLPDAVADAVPEGGSASRSGVAVDSERVEELALAHAGR